MDEKVAFLEARQTALPAGKRMPVSPMTEVEAEEDLSQEVPKGAPNGTQEEGKVLSGAVNHTGEDEEETEEGRKAKVKRGPEGPTKKERQEHEATHCPYRSWCRRCVRGRGRNSPHFKKKEPEDDSENKVARVSMDYFFMSVEDEKASSNPIIVMIDEGSGSVYARGTGRKGVTDMDWLRKESKRRWTKMRQAGDGSKRRMIKETNTLKRKLWRRTRQGRREKKQAALVLVLTQELNRKREKGQKTCQYRKTRTKKEEQRGSKKEKVRRNSNQSG